MKIDFEEDFFLVDKGRTHEERSIVLVEDGQYRGFGYVSLEELNESTDSLKDAIKPFRHHPETVKIIHSFLHKSGLKVIPIP